MRPLLSAFFLTASCLFSTAPQATAQTPAPPKLWDQTFGGSNYDNLHSLQQTSDGGYILGGSSQSPISGNKTQPIRGMLYDYWVIKLDATGTKVWEKVYGGTEVETLTSIQQTSDGGYVLGGISYSNISGDKTQFGRGSSDYWVVKLDASGNKQWDKRFGGASSEYLSSLQQTSDGGYILGGGSQSLISGDKTQNNAGRPFTDDYWVVKIDAAGTKLWDKSFGTYDDDELLSLQQTSDGGYMLAGRTDSGINGDKTQASQGGYDYWVVKLDASGIKQWDKSFGGSGEDLLNSMQQTSDGGYLLGGNSLSGISGDKTQPSRGQRDYWVVKLDAAGTKQWDKTFGGSDVDELYFLQQTSDAGYVLGGSSQSGISGDKTQAHQGSKDYWVVKLDATGTQQWDKTLGGSGYDDLLCLRQTSDGSYILGGSSSSPISGDKTQANFGPLTGQGVPFTSDYWVVKIGVAPLATTAATTRPALSAYPNPARTQFTLRGPVGTPYQLLNQLGQVVRAGQLSAQPLDVQALPVGLYLLRDQTTGLTTKLVKE